MKRLWQWCGIGLFWLSWPLLWLYFRPSQRTRVIVVWQNKVLLVKGWLSSGQWGLPGGGRHQGEAAAEGACRELLEETGLAISPQDLRTIGAAQTVQEVGLTFQLTVFMVELHQPPNLKLARLEMVDWRWAPPAEIVNDTSVSRLSRQLVQAWSDQANLLH